MGTGQEDYDHGVVVDEIELGGEVRELTAVGRAGDRILGGTEKYELRWWRGEDGRGGDHAKHKERREE